MMQTIIDLWDGNIAPSEHCGARDGEAETMRGLDRETEGVSGKVYRLFRGVPVPYAEAGFQ